jgi:hypothetical protein
MTSAFGSVKHHPELVLDQLSLSPDILNEDYGNFCPDT